LPNDKGIGYTSLAIGGFFVWSGIKGYSVVKALQNVVMGQPANTGQSSSLLGSDTPPTGGGGGSGVPAPKGSWSHDGLMKLWVSEGGSQTTANNAACHAIQESSGDPAVTSSNPDGGINVGLWQLDTKGKGAGHSVESLKDPHLNCRITIAATHNGQDWSAWATPGC
jgi:lysozyme-like protein